jgi:undecaprenyl-diphosphatase
VYFWSRILAFFRRGVSYDDAGKLRRWWRHPVALVLISFAVTAVPCYVIDDKIGENLESLPIMAWALIIGGVVMWIVDAWAGRRERLGAGRFTRQVEEMTLVQAVVIGAAQILAAAFPGTSRSMATIAAGQVMGLSRPAALEFSFFLSIPVMFAATGFKLAQFVMKQPIAIDGRHWGVLAVGFIVSFIVALVVIHWFMAWVRRHGFAPFAVYRIVAGAALIAWISLR